MERQMTKIIFAAFATLALTSVGAQAETAVERQCSTGKCTCSYIASTCRDWNKKHGGDLAACDGYRQACLASGSWQDRNRSIPNVVRR
jgi:hypothetical protein